MMMTSWLKPSLLLSPPGTGTLRRERDGAAVDRVSDARLCFTRAVSRPTVPMRACNLMWFHFKSNQRMTTPTGQRSWCRSTISVHHRIVIQLHVWLCANRVSCQVRNIITRQSPSPASIAAGDQHPSAPLMQLAKGLIEVQG